MRNKNIYICIVFFYKAQEQEIQNFSASADGFDRKDILQMEDGGRKD